MNILILIFSFFTASTVFADEDNQFVFESEPPVDCLEDYQEDLDNMDGYVYKDYCVYKASARFEELGVEFVKKPDDGKMKGLAFIKDPDGYWVEILSANGLAELSIQTD